MSAIEHEMDEDRYRETTILHKRHLTDEVLRVPLKHIKSRDPIQVSPEATIQEVLDVMKVRSTGAVLVCEQDPFRLSGIFTERDLLLRVAGQGWKYKEHKIREVMTSHPDCLTTRDTIGFALKMMMTHGYRHIPIVRKNGDPCGLVSVRDLLLYLSEHFPEDVINLPPGDVIPSEREGG